MSSRDASAVEERLEALERVHGFVALVDERELPDGTLTARYRFVHVLYQNALYKQLRATRRVALNAGVAEALLQLHGTRAPNIAAELAALFEAARQPLRAAQYRLIATQNAARLFASHEVLGLATRGLALLDTATATPERRVTELGLLISLGNAFIALRGYAAGEVLDTYTRALSVSEQLGETQDRAAVLYGFAAYHLVGGRHPQALSMARELLAFTERRQHPAVIVAHRLVGWALLAMGQTDGALTHLERGRALYDPSVHDALAYSFGQEPGMAVTVMFAVGLQIVGRADEARQVCAEALNLRARPVTPTAGVTSCTLRRCARSAAGTVTRPARWPTKRFASPRTRGWHCGSAGAASCGGGRWPTPAISTPDWPRCGAASTPPRPWAASCAIATTWPCWPRC